jgi:hypothetical protein
VWTVVVLVRASGVLWSPLDSERRPTERGGGRRTVELGDSEWEGSIKAKCLVEFWLTAACACRP